MPLAAIHDEDVESGSQDDLPTTVAPMPGNFAAALAMETPRSPPPGRAGAIRDLPRIDDTPDPDGAGETVLIGRDERLGGPQKVSESGVHRGSTTALPAAPVARPAPEDPSGPRAIYTPPAPPPLEARPLLVAAPSAPAPLPTEMSPGRKLAVGVLVFLLTASALSGGVFWLWLHGLPR